MRWLGLFAPPHKKISLCHTDMRASDSWRNGNDISYNIGPEAESVLCPGISPVPDTCAVTRRQGSENDGNKEMPVRACMSSSCMSSACETLSQALAGHLHNTALI